MNKEKKGLNGSADLLAQAFRQTVQEALNPVLELMGNVDSRMKNVDSKIDTLGKDLTEVKTRQEYHQKALDGLKERETRKSA